MTKNPLVSILIPVHNGEKYLAEAIDSVLAQTYNNWELIIINDASTDKTVDIIKNYIKQDKRISLFSHQTKKYRAGALNTGIKKAKGAFICFLDADDIYAKDKTERQVKFMRENPEVDMVYGERVIFNNVGITYRPKAIRFHDDPQEILREISEKNILPKSPPYKLLGYKDHYRIIPGCSVMIRKKVFKDVAFDENLRTCQDYDLWFQIIGHRFTIKHLGLLAYYYRHHEQQISNTKKTKIRNQDYDYILKKLKSWEYFKIPGKTKPKILLVPNIANWAFDFEADQIIKHFSHKYDFTKIYHADFFMGPENYSKYDKIFVFFWPTLKYFLKHLSPKEAKEKLMAGVFSYNSWEGHKKEAQKLFTKCRGVVVNDKNLAKIFKSKNYQTYYAPKWVDHRHFKPLSATKRSKKLIVGWAGNPDHNGKNYKGFWNILLPVCETNKDWIDLKTAMAGHDRVPYNKMPRFYNSLDVITCLSKAETGPNTLLEAGACGIPSISTQVGVAPELIKNGFNGWIIERNKGALEKVLKKAYREKNKLKIMGRKTRQKILKDWTCDKNIKIYDKIFSEY